MQLPGSFNAFKIAELLIRNRFHPYWRICLPTTRSSAQKNAPIILGRFDKEFLGGKSQRLVSFVASTASSAAVLQQAGAS